jgi:hypothetical protein
MKKFILPMIMVVIGLALNAGPFGFEKGMTAKQMKNKGIGIERFKNDLYEFTNVDGGDYRFFGLIDNDKGLYFLRVSTDNIFTNSYGLQIKLKYDEIVDIMISKYGKPTTDINILLPGSIWNEVNDFMMALFKEERCLITSWEFEQGEIEAIFVEVKAISTNEAIVMIDYYFSGQSEIEEKLKREKTLKF